MRQHSVSLCKVWLCCAGSGQGEQLTVSTTVVTDGRSSVAAAYCQFPCECRDSQGCLGTGGFVLALSCVRGWLLTWLTSVSTTSASQSVPEPPAWITEPYPLQNVSTQGQRLQILYDVLVIQKALSHLWSLAW